MRGQQSGASLGRWWPVSIVAKDTCKTHQLSKDKNCKVCQETAQPVSQDYNLPRGRMGSSNLRQLCKGPHIQILSSTSVLGQLLSWRSLTPLPGTLLPFVFTDKWYDSNDGAQQSNMLLLPSSQIWSKVWHWSRCLQTWSTHLHLLAVPCNTSLRYTKPLWYSSALASPPPFQSHLWETINSYTFYLCSSKSQPRDGTSPYHELGVVWMLKGRGFLMALYSCRPHFYHALGRQDLRVVTLIHHSFYISHEQN